ncbi:transmembrane protein 256 homolog [Lampetra planeri]
MAEKVFLTVAGISGFLAVGLGAYGAHKFKPATSDAYLKSVFETANRYHFIHTLAMLAAPQASRPLLAGSLMTTGILLFSGSCYLLSLTGHRSLGRVTPFGGLCLMAAWLAMAL